MTRALFSSAKDALRFALNHEDLTIPSPLMNKEMADAPVITSKGQGTGAGMEGPPSRRSGLKSIPLGGMADRTVMAGWILQRLEQLAPIDKSVLKAVLINPRRICACGAACCRGWSVKAEWVNQIRFICEFMKEEADLAKQPGKKGLSSDPRLRNALVEDYCRAEAKRYSIADLSKVTDASTVTVAKHRELIHGLLGEIELRAWQDIGALFDAAGITGALQES